MAIARILKFCNEMSEISPYDVQSACVAEMDYLKMFYTLKSYRRELTKYRNALKELNKNGTVSKVTLSCALKTLVLSKSELDALDDSHRKQITSDLMNLRPIHDIDAYINEAVELLESSSYAKRIIALCALTGRRASEIGATANFTIIEKHRKSVLFDGQLKTKTRNNVKPFVIPTLADSSIIVETLHKIRIDKPQYIDAPSKFHDGHSSGLNKAVKSCFDGISDKQLSVKDLRSIYGELCYFFEGNNRIAKSKFISNILGHGEHDVETGQSYLDFYIADSKYTDRVIQ